jgi:WD40 repeat protein
MQKKIITNTTTSARDLTRLISLLNQGHNIFSDNRQQLQALFSQLSVQALFDLFSQVNGLEYLKPSAEDTLQGQARLELWQLLFGLPDNPKEAMAQLPQLLTTLAVICPKNIRTDPPQCVQTLTNHREAVTNSEFSAQGRHLLTVSEGTALIWAMANGELVHKYALQGEDLYPLTDAAFSSDGQYIVATFSDGAAKVYAVATGELLHDVGGALCCNLDKPALSPNNQYLFTADGDVWDLAIEDKPIQELSRNYHAIDHVALSSNGKYLLTAESNDEKSVILWTVTSTGQVHKRTLLRDKEEIQSLAFSPDNRFVSMALSNGSVKIYRLDNGYLGKSYMVLAGHRTALKECVFSSDSEQVATTAENDSSVKIWQSATGRLLHTLSDSTEITSIAFHPQGQYLATAAADGPVNIWQMVTGRLLHTLPTHDAAVNNVIFSPNGRYLVATSAEGTINLWLVGR